MNKQILIVAALALVVAACTPPKKPDPTKPQVTVVDGKINIDQEEISFKPEEKNVTIAWQLPKGSNHRFTRDGIAFEKPDGEIVECQPRSEGLEFTCLNRHTKPGTYKYAIKVQEGNNPPVVRDPTVRNF